MLQWNALSPRYVLGIWTPKCLPVQAETTMGMGHTPVLLEYATPLEMGYIPHPPHNNCCLKSDTNALLHGVIDIFSPCNQCRQGPLLGHPDQALTGDSKRASNMVYQVTPTRFQIFIRTPVGQTILFWVDDTERVKNLEQKIGRAHV